MTDRLDPLRMDPPGNRRHRTRGLLAILVLALAALGAGCGGSSDDSTGDVSAGGGGEKLTVGSDIPYPPFEQGKPGDYTGFDVELMEAIGAEIGREVEFQDAAFTTIFVNLGQGRFDVVASAATITPEREKTVDFSNPYYLSEQAILVEQGGEPYESLEDLAGATVGVQKGSTGQEFLSTEGEVGELRPYPTGPDAFNALNSGALDAVVIDIPAAEAAAESSDSLEISGAIPTEEEFGFAVAQGETELLGEINSALEALEKDGTYEQLYEKWFHRAPPAATMTATHEAG